MEQGKMPINIMILGRTGVGKSTLINYIHGSEVVKTGAGKPITPKGEFNKITVPYPLKPDVALNIFDSWGLEPDKAEKWDAIISAKLSATLLFAEMISGIVYCFSYSEKIVDFEIKMLKKLLNKQYKVIIALTKADFIHDNEELKTIYLDRLAEELAEYRDSYTVVDICAEEIQKFTKSSSILPFGKETLLGAIAHDARDNFFKFAYRQWTDWKNESQEKLRQFRERKIKEIIDFKVGFLDNNEKKVQDIVHTIDNEWSILSNDILTKIKTSTQDAVMLYKEIEAHSGATEDAAEERKKNITFWDVVKKTLFVITLPITVPFNIIDSIGDHIDSVTEYMKEKPNIQKALVDYLNKSIDDIDKKINDAYSELEKMLS